MSTLTVPTPEEHGKGPAAAAIAFELATGLEVGPHKAAEMDPQPTRRPWE